jgi:hypothetical protein
MVVAELAAGGQAVVADRGGRSLAATFTRVPPIEVGLARATACRYYWCTYALA